MREEKTEDQPNPAENPASSPKTLLPKKDASLVAVVYPFRTLFSVEQRYTKIEKEALAISWGCDKSNYYLAGWEFIVEMGHKPQSRCWEKKS